jgi:hypothetical protein
MPESAPRGDTAYICECGRKWVFPKAAAATLKPLRRSCRCGRTIVVAKGLVYSTPPGTAKPTNP